MTERGKETQHEVAMPKEPKSAERIVEWWDTKPFAYFEVLMSIVIGGTFSYLNKALGIPILIILFCLSCLSLWRAYSKQQVLVPILVTALCGIGVLIADRWLSTPLQGLRDTLPPETSNEKNQVDTQQAIRTLLESVEPDILRLLDEKEKQIHVFMSDSKYSELSELSKRPDFGKFMEFQRSGAKCIGGLPEPGIVKERNYYGLMQGYYLHPKDALVR